MGLRLKKYKRGEATDIIFFFFYENSFYCGSLKDKYNSPKLNTSVRNSLKTQQKLSEPYIDNSRSVTWNYIQASNFCI